MVPEPRQKVALLHNYYLERGGEDVSFESERALLNQNHHEVRVYTRHNSEIKSYSLFRSLKLPLQTVWAADSYADVRHLLSSERFDVCHFNNTFPLISPSAYDACREAHVAVVQNLRNYRLICPNGYLFRDHRVCEDCVGRRMPWPGVLHACYRDSRIESAVVAMMLFYHNIRKTWLDRVDTYIALTNFARQKFIEGGLPARKIVVKPNFVFDHGMADGPGDHALFIGRLTEGKGIFELLKAWSGCPEIPLKMVGDGPLLRQTLDWIRQENIRNIEICGRLSSEATLALLRSARFLVYPSVWYENFPRVLLESFSCGRPVIASNIGAAPELIEHRTTGILFRSGDAEDLAENVRWLWYHPAESRSMGQGARHEYEQKYSPERNYQMLMEIYSRAISGQRT